MFRRKQLTDAEYVEQVRRRDRTLRRMWWMWPLLLLATLYCLMRGFDLVHGLSADFPVEKQIVYTGVLLGVLYGFVLSMLAFQAGHCIKQWVDARKGFRTERLMLKYHDELKGMGSSDDTAESIRRRAVRSSRLSR